jgi:hypothetical protein
MGWSGRVPDLKAEALSLNSIATTTKKKKISNS